jgi:hypothetical protein
MSELDHGHPTPRMVRLYHALSEMLGGEPADLWVYEPDSGPVPGSARRPTLKHVMVWPANDEVDVCTFNTLGMSEEPIPGTGYRAELHMGVRKFLRNPQRERLARFLANAAEYPFHHGRAIDWWQVIANPGEIPEFPGCKHLLLHPKFTDEGFDTIDDQAGPVRLFYVVPITPLERHLLVDHGRELFLEYTEAGGLDLLADRIDPPGALREHPEMDTP